jgi:hypothetical protein
VLVVTRPGPQPGVASGPLPIAEPGAVAALTALEFECRSDVVVDAFASPPVSGSACQRVSSGFQQGLGMEFLNVDLRRGEGGVVRATLALRQIQLENQHNSGSDAPPSQAPMDHAAALEQLTAVVRSVLPAADAAMVEAAVRSMIDAGGQACNCEQSTPIGRVRLDGDPLIGYAVSIGALEEPLPAITPPPSPMPFDEG